MAQQVAAVDLRDGSQGTDANATNTHAMAGRKPNGNMQNCQQALQGTQQQIIDDVKSGDLTKALHTIQDAYSPSHYPFQPWDGGYTPLHIPSPGHMYGDFKPPQSAIDAATNASAQFLRDITQNPSGPDYKTYDVHKASEFPFTTNRGDAIKEITIVRVPAD